MDVQPKWNLRLKRSLVDRIAIYHSCLIMSHMPFRVNLQFVVAWMSRKSLLETGVISSLAKWLSVCLQTKWLWIQIPLQSLKTSDTASLSSKEFLKIPATKKCRFTLKHVYDMEKTPSRMRQTGKRSQHSSIIKNKQINQ